MCSYNPILGYINSQVFNRECIIPLDQFNLLGNQGAIVQLEASLARHGFTGVIVVDNSTVTYKDLP